MAYTKARGGASTVIIVLLLTLIALVGGGLYWASQVLDERDERVSDVESRVAQLADRLDGVSAMEDDIEALAKRVDGIEKRLEASRPESEDLAARLDELSERVDSLADDLDEAGRSEEELNTLIREGIEDYAADESDSGQQSESNETDSSGDDDGSAGLDDTDPIMGNPDARISIIEYSDLECPYCKRLHEAGTITKVVEGSNGDVNATLRHFPLTSIHGRAAVEAALGAECVQMNAGDEAFFALVEAYFDSTGGGGDGIGTPVAEFAAEQSGMDAQAVASCMDSDEAMKRVRDDFNSARSKGVESTPTMLVRNHETGETQTVSGAVGADKLREAIDSLTEQ